MNDSEAQRRAEAVRHFNRFYTQHIGALHEYLQKSAFSLTEVRVLHELARGHAQTAAALTRNLGLDSGYLSRLLTSFERRNLLTRRPSESDARQSLLSLTDAGMTIWQPLDEAARAEVAAVLAQIPPESQEWLIDAMQRIEWLLDPELRRSPVTLRAVGPGEYGWLVHRQAQWFATEYDWDPTFEGMLLRVVADFLRHRDPLRETGWVAEQAGAIVGSAMVVCVSTTVARVRLLYVEPEARRLGIGTQLLDECVQFATRAGYTKLTLWTTPFLHDARRLCERRGFVCAANTSEWRFGRDLPIEHWERDL